MLHIEAQNALAALNLKQQIEQGHDTSSLLNQALEDVVFRFEKIGEAELKLADELKDILRRTRETLGGTQDPARANGGARDYRVLKGSRRSFGPAPPGRGR